MNPFSSGFPDLGAIAGIGGGGSAAATTAGAASFLNPLTLGLGAASIGTSLFGASRAADATRQAGKDALRAAKIQAAQADRAAALQAMLGREQMKGGMAMDIGSRVAAGTYLPDLDLGRQMEAKMFEAGPLAERQLATKMMGERAMIGLEGSKEYQRLRDRESQRRIKEQIAPFAGKYAAMFGGINPINTQNLFV